MLSKKHSTLTIYVPRGSNSLKLADQLNLQDKDFSNPQDIRVAKNGFYYLVAITSISKNKILLVTVDKDLKFKQQKIIGLIPTVKQVRIYYSKLKDSFYLLQSECQDENRNCRVISQKIDNHAKPMGKNERIVELDTADCELIDFNVLRPNDRLVYVCKKNLSFGHQKSIDYLVLKAMDLTEDALFNDIELNLSYLGPSEIWDCHVDEYKRLLEIKYSGEGDVNYWNVCNPTIN